MIHPDELKPLSPLAQARPPVELDLTIVVPVRGTGQSVTHTLTKLTHALHALSPKYPRSEIILVPTELPGERDATTQFLNQHLQTARLGDSVRVVVHRGPLGKGAALRTGFSCARGRFIVTTDGDLPYDLSFIEAALERLEGGVSIVVGNRRRAESFFDLPVSLLGVAAHRHRLGVWFNALVRTLFGLKLRDTQAGIKAFQAHVAWEIFSKLECPGFFYDLEIFLRAKANHWSVVDLPVVLTLSNEKSTVRVLRESVLAAYWLMRLRVRSWARQPWT